MTLAAFLLGIALGTPALAGAEPVESPCGELGALETAAFQADLTEQDRSCIEGALFRVEPAVRVRMSFLLIIEAYARGQNDRYLALLRRHLGEVNPTDADVAYLYALLLATWGPEHGEEVIRWANVALDHRRQWVQNPPTYRAMVRSLYNLRNEASMARAIEAEKWHTAVPDATNKERVDTYKQRARYYLAASGPCLVQGNCGPEFKAIVEDQTGCADLSAARAAAEGGQLGETQVACLRGRWMKQEGRREDVLEVLVTWAEHSGGDAWDMLETWYRNETGTDSALLSWREARFLAAQGPVWGEEVIALSTAAIEQREQLDDRVEHDALLELHKLRSAAAQELVEEARFERTRTGSADAQALLDKREKQVEELRKAWETWCSTEGQCVVPPAK